MSVSVMPVEAGTVSSTSRLMSFVELTKPRIAVLVLVVVAISAAVARWGLVDMTSIAHALLGTLLVAGSASAMNQWIERYRDARMPRTSARPLPSGRLSSSSVLCFGVITFLAGVIYLTWMTNLVAAFWAVITWVLYVGVYTPMKVRTPLNTTVGAIAGAMPVLIGWTAAGGTLNLWADPRGWALFMVVFIWQFPHFMAIAWMYRQQYEQAGMKMSTVVDPSGRSAGIIAVCGALALLPVSLVPALASPMDGSQLFVLISFTLGVAQLICATRFLVERSDQAARQLLRASLVYLPTLLLFLVIIPWI